MAALRYRACPCPWRNRGVYRAAAKTRPSTGRRRCRCRARVKACASRSLSYRIVRSGDSDPALQAVSPQSRGGGGREAYRRRGVPNAPDARVKPCSRAESARRSLLTMVSASRSAGARPAGRRVANAPAPRRWRSGAAAVSARFRARRSGAASSAARCGNTHRRARASRRRRSALGGVSRPPGADRRDGQSAQAREQVPSRAGRRRPASSLASARRRCRAAAAPAPSRRRPCTRVRRANASVGARRHA